MAVFKNARLWHGGSRIDTDLTAMEAEYGVEEQDDTRFNDNTRKMASDGLFDLSAGIEGFWEGGDDAIEGNLFTTVGGEVVISIAPNVGSAGEVCYFSQYLFSQFTQGAAVGDQFAISGSAAGREQPLVRGNVLHNATEGATGAGSAQNLGSVGSSESLYAALHVVSSSGDGSQTLDVTIESDSADDFTGAETTRITFSQVTTSPEAQWATPVGGAITDTWWRAAFTVGGTGSPSFEIAVLMGIL